jgi:preprotein translocase subunit YajC
MFAAIAGLLADATDAPKGVSPFADPLVMLMIFGLPLILFIMLPARREARARQAMLSLIKKGDRVLINGFMIGNVVQIIKPDNQPGEDELLVKVDDNANIKLRVLRGSVTRILKSDESTTKEGT